MRLWLDFKDENGQDRRVEAAGELFTIGRHSANDLAVADSRLSREHVRIENVDGDFYVSDPGSSNGTTINGEKLTSAVRLKNGDKLDLGGGLEIKTEIEDNGAAAMVPATPDVPADPITPPAAAAPAPVIVAAAPESGGIPTSFFIIAPLLGLMVLVIVGGLVIFLGRGSTQDVAQNDDDDEYSTTNSRRAGGDDEDEPLAKANRSPSPENTPGNGGIATPSPMPGGTDQPPSANLSDTAKVEQDGAAFLRRIAQNEPKAFLTTDQAQRVNVRVKQIGKGSGLADNINAARKNAAQLKTLATAKNLKPQFLAVAAIVKLGSSRGDVMQAAQSVADVYDKLATQIGSEFSDDALLMVAAFDQGEAGDTMKMRNMLQDLATKSNEGVRTIRTIWWLEKNGKITPAEFDRALNFLAIGTITQNPKDFGVNAEALTL